MTTAQRATKASPRLLPYLSAVHAQWLADDPDRAWSEVAGTLVFADVSGFTALAERLAKGGKVGAEALTAVLNDLFGRLLAAAGSYGGDCLKFGGDALLLLFTGEGHAGRGVAAAHELVQITERFRPARASSAGSVRLGMSVGAGCGQVLAVLSGTDHRELIVLGPTVSETLHAEHEAVSGQVLLSAALAAAVPGEPAAPARQPSSAAPADREGAARRGLSPHLVAHLTGEPQDGEHRLAAIGFVRFCGTDDLLRTAGPPAVADALQELLSRAQRAEAVHGVTLISTDADLDGGKLILVAGVPTASPDESDRLLLALRDIVVPASTLSVQAGAHYGRVFTADLGADHRRTFTVMGDAVNLSARLMAHAQPGQVLASRDLLERVQTSFQVTAVEPFAAKGKSALVEAGLVGEPLGLRAIEQLDDLPLIGRQEELAALAEAVTAVRSGTGSVVEVIGEAGLGKSKLLRTAAHSSGLPTVEVRGGGYSRATAYYALRAPLRALLAMTAKGVSETAAQELRAAITDRAPELLPWLPLVGSVLGIELPETAETAGLGDQFRAAKLRTVLRALFERLLDGATLWLVEDGHSLDTTTAELLGELAAAPLPWLFVLSRRPVPGGWELPDDAARRLVLTVLSDDDAAALLESSLTAGGKGLVPGAVQQLVKRAGGNPLFLRELLLVATTRALDDLPESIEAVVSTMIDTLPARDRDLLRRAAVLGTRFPLQILASTLGVAADELAPRLDPLRSFLQSDGSLVAFSHLLLRDVAYETLPYRARRELHARAGEAWEAQAGDRPHDVAELLAVHFHAARSHERSWRYSLVAAERAQRAAAPVEAASFYRQALEAARRLPEVTTAQEASVAERLGDASLLGGRYADARSAYARARRHASSPLQTARLHRKAGTVWDQQGRYTSSIRACRRGLSLMPALADDPHALKEAAKLLSQNAVALLRKGQIAQARPLLEEAVALAGTSDARGHRAALANAYRYLNWQAIESQDADAERFGLLAQELYAGLGDNAGLSQIFNNLGIGAYYRGDWDRAVDYYERSREAAARAGSLITEALLLNNTAEVLSDQGHLTAAESKLRTALTVFRGARHGFEGMALGNLGRLLGRAGRYVEAEQVFDLACVLLEHNRESALLAETQARRAEALVLAGDAGRALTAVATAQRLTSAQSLPTTQPLLTRVTAWAHAQQGDQRTAWRLLSRAAMDSRQRDDVYGTAVALQGLAQLAHLRGSPSAVAGFAAFAAAQLADLGVVTTPEVPLGAD